MFFGVFVFFGFFVFFGVFIGVFWFSFVAFVVFLFCCFYIRSLLWDIGHPEPEPSKKWRLRNTAYVTVPVPYFL